jgi:hypothetical protein
MRVIIPGKPSAKALLHIFSTLTLQRLTIIHISAGQFPALRMDLQTPMMAR